MTGETEETILTTDDTQSESEDSTAETKDDVTAEETQDDTSADETSESNADDSKDEDSSDAYADFDLPEDVTLNQSMLDEALPVFKELGLTQEQAQKLVDIQVNRVKASQQEQVDAFNQLKLDWIEQTKSDAEIGGDNFETTVAEAKSAVDAFGNEGFTKLLNDYGIGNHPEVIRFMAKVGKLTKEDNPDDGGQNVNQQPTDHVSVLYGKRN